MTDWHAALTARVEELDRQIAEVERLLAHPELRPDGDDDGTGPMPEPREYRDSRGRLMYVG